MRLNQVVLLLQILEARGVSGENGLHRLIPCKLAPQLARNAIARSQAAPCSGRSSKSWREADLPLEPQSAAQAHQMHGPTSTKRTNSGQDAGDQEALHRPPVRAADAVVLAIVPSDIRRAAALPALFAGGGSWVPSRQLLEVSAPKKAAVSPDEGMDGSGEVFLQRNSADPSRCFAKQPAFISRPPRRHPFQPPLRTKPPAPATGAPPRGSARPLSGREARSLAAPAVAGAAIPTLANGASGSYCRLEFGPGPPLSGYRHLVRV